MQSYQATYLYARFAVIDSFAEDPIFHVRSINAALFENVAVMKSIEVCGE
jgi:hypothetical protein